MWHGIFSLLAVLDNSNIACLNRPESIECQKFANRYLKETKNLGIVLFNDTLNTFLFTVIWRRTYGKGSLR